MFKHLFQFKIKGLLIAVALLAGSMWRHTGPVPPVSFLWYHQLARQVGPLGVGVRLP